MSVKKTLGVIVLAGGKRALREKEAPDIPKLLEDVSGTPVLGHVIMAARGITQIPVKEITTVISTRYEDYLRKFLTSLPFGVKTAVQPNHRGTADAVWNCIMQGVFPNTTYVMVLLGDQPLITSQDLDKFCKCITTAKTRGGILTFRENRNNPDYKKCGVVYRDKFNHFTELKSRTEVPQNGDEELHAGPYLFEGPWLRGVLKALAPHHAHPVKDAPEFHLYEALLAALGDTGVSTCLSDHPKNFLGVDTLHALEEVRKRI